MIVSSNILSKKYARVETNAYVHVQEMSTNVSVCLQLELVQYIRFSIDTFGNEFYI